MMLKTRDSLLGCAPLALAAAFTCPAYAQSAPEPTQAATSQGVEDIIVTARRRDETSIAVPVSITALGAQQLEDQAIRTLDDVARLTPSLTVGQATSGVGGTIVLRGVGTAAGTQPTFDQTVSVNIDGVQVSRGNAVRFGQIDMQSIEILKGPQALFFGKNSPAGVISIRSADPGDEFEAMLRTTYDPMAEGVSGDAVISGPIAPFAKVRLAGSISDTKGWFTNDVAKALPANAITPNSVRAGPDRGPASRFYFGRATVLLDPSDRLRIRGKYTYAKNEGDFVSYGLYQRVHCASGTANVAGQAAALGGAPGLAAALAVDDCQANSHYTQGNANPAFQVGSTGDVGGEQGGSRSSFGLASVEATYDLSSDISITSVTGHASLKDRIWGTYSYGPSDAVAAVDYNIPTNYSAFTQEVRIVTSSSSSIINGVFGVFYEDSGYDSSVRLFSAAAPVFNNRIEGEALSVFGQALLDITPEVEAAAGGRWTREKKFYEVTRNGVPQALGVSQATFENFSPEITLTYRPSTSLTTYAAYKTGFKSGGFAATLTSFSPPTAAVGLNNLFRPEKVRGGELGLKAAFANNRVRLNIAGYYNDFTDLQVNSIDNSTGVPIIKVRNAAAATVKGVEADISWRPEGTRGLDFRAAVNYNISEYTDYIAPCFIGQTIAEGCNQSFNTATGQFAAQDLSGRPLLNAPRWSASIGSSYSTPLNDAGLSGGISGDLSYKSRYTPHPDEAPWSFQKGAAFLNGTVRLYDEKSGWEVAVIGRNLTNIYRVSSGSNVPATGVGTSTGTTTTGGHADLVGYVNRGREILFQLTLRPSRW